jgi:hypothetical protein
MKALLLALAVIVLGCTKPNPNVCCTDEADCAAKGIPVGSICEQGLVCRGNQCISEPCSQSSDCDAAAPYCVAELCAEQCSEDSHCPGFGQDVSRLFCVGGQCLECRESAACPAAEPVCDQGACRGCNADADCASGVCDADTAVCIDEALIAYVTPSGSTTSDCSRLDPCTLAHAFALINANGPRTAIKLGGSGSHSMGVTNPTGSVSATIYGPGTMSGDGGVEDGATLRIRDVVWNGSPGSYNSAPNLPFNTLDLLRVKMSVYSGYTPMCNVTIRDSTLRSTSGTLNPQALITIDGETAGVGGATSNRGATLVIERSFLEGGTPAIAIGAHSTARITNTVFAAHLDMYGAIRIASTAAATSTVEFSSFYNTLLKCGTTTGTGFLTLANNIFYNAKVGAPADTATGTDCSHRYDMVTPQATSLPGPGNILNKNPQWLNAFANDFHLGATSPAIDSADPMSTEPADYEGTTRPQGAARDIGAFEYH